MNPYNHNPKTPATTPRPFDTVEPVRDVETLAVELEIARALDARREEESGNGAC